MQSWDRDRRKPRTWALTAVLLALCASAAGGQQWREGFETGLAGARFILPFSNATRCFAGSKGRSVTESANIISVKLRLASARCRERNGDLPSCFA